MQRSVGLKFMPNEDATFGFWVSGLNLRHVDHPLIKTTAGHCSFQFINAEVYALVVETGCVDGNECCKYMHTYIPSRICVVSAGHAHPLGMHESACACNPQWLLSKQNSMPRFVDASFREEEDVCSGWLLCHKIMTAWEMRYMHYRYVGGGVGLGRPSLRSRRQKGYMETLLEEETPCAIHDTHTNPPCLTGCNRVQQTVQCCNERMGLLPRCAPTSSSGCPMWARNALHGCRTLSRCLSSHSLSTCCPTTRRAHTFLAMCPVVGHGVAAVDGSSHIAAHRCCQTSCQPSFVRRHRANDLSSLPLPSTVRCSRPTAPPTPLHCVKHDTIGDLMTTTYLSLFPIAFPSGHRCTSTHTQAHGLAKHAAGHDHRVEPSPRSVSAVGRQQQQHPRCVSRHPLPAALPPCWRALKWRRVHQHRHCAGWSTGSPTAAANRGH